MSRAAVALGIALWFSGTGCGEELGAPAGQTAMLGIVAWHDPPAYVTESADLESGADWSEGTWGPGPPLVAPDTVERGASFTVIATTTRPNGCWHPGGYEKETGASEATIVAYDYRTESEICTLIFGWTTREVELQFDHPGEALIRLVGRRIAGEDFGGGEEIVIEHRVTVR